ncbi:hypothetical protein E5F05_06095 [Deinococcus metallilatus]|uniref:Murein DD-endopeptidase MepM/ murein hydrolase activator NlpD n=1 Tax=Deinococcus metallilatus TaxID=1211322 RepID=A0AAJ5F6F3_9DEIO|nr:peptidoglycan DD-metalloendopeptidase family protein [Deinococcus metallilatus]MBB5294511.1 murein DD-endopeptidase MepM/ murein hydrolase activator NlpD [Deinococcus metallilatus]QBY07560.1 hypothetical protein E5F05_06095 [Deinococcus metallilatus]RXJ13976.1 hypothetical protein ERJ73_04930 [Deinococcus metallilatus]TLK29941.1 hypothetical protein FCS05_05245 [Deinococcus metallilatus]GMA15726.1 hypothetical protein GCM10025871_20570 [Deinococcus metallilatus]
MTAPFDVPALPSPPDLSARTAPGREEDRDVPGLEGHRGPGLILRWNTLAVTDRVDVVLHFHGFSAHGAAMNLARDKEGASGLDWSDPRGLDPAPGRTRPTLGLLPRGHFYGGRSGAGYDFPALVRPGGARELIRWSLERFAARAGVPALGVNRLILTAHSGGGAATWRVLDDLDPHEVHVFDALYQSPEPLLRWARRRIGRDAAAPEASLETYMREQGGALRVLYTSGGGTAGNSLEAYRQLERALAGHPALHRWYAVERTSVSHGEIPRRYGWRLLADAGATLPDTFPPGRATSGGRPTLRPGDRGEAVREAQRKLNVVHARELAAGRPGLPGAPLAEDGTFSPDMRAATVAFQQLAFPGEPRAADGVIGPRTWARLDEWAGGTARPSTSREAAFPDAEAQEAQDPEASEFPDEEEAEGAPPPLPVRAEPRPLPPDEPVPFAPAPPPGSFWPLRTENSEGRLVSYITVDGHMVGRAGRAFLAARQGTRGGQTLPRRHVGVDLYAHAGDTVVACEDGRIVEFAFFYRAKSGQRTYRLLVAHPAVVVNYGEVTEDSLTRHGLAVGDTVRAGQPLAFVSDTGMLHFETYAPDTVHSAQWWPDRPRPSNLLNPTRYLLFLQERGQGGADQTPAGQTPGSHAPAESPAAPPDGLPPLTGPRVPPGFRAVARRGSVRGLARYGGGRVDETLRRLAQAGRTTLPEDEIDTLQRVANVETGGLIQGLNTWDSAVVSIGFMQWTLQHGKLQEWIRRAEAAFRRHGIELDTGRVYTWTRDGRVVSEQGAVLGAATRDELRWDGWAQRFFHAGLDEEAIVAEAELAREHLRRHLAGLRAYLGDAAPYRVFTGHYAASPRVRGMFQAAYNNLPVAAKRGTVAALHAAGNAGTERFTDLLQDALLEAYRERNDNGTRIISETRTGARSA